MIAEIPDEYIPSAEVKRLDRESVGGKRRKSSVTVDWGSDMVEEEEEEANEQGRRSLLIQRVTTIDSAERGWIWAMQGTK